MAKTETLMKELNHVGMEEGGFQPSTASKLEVIYIWNILGKKTFEEHKFIDFFGLCAKIFGV